MILDLGAPLANACGFAGMAAVVAAYGYGTAAAAPNPYLQHGLNLAGSILLTLSLLVNVNPASLVLEAFWSAIAIWGLAKAVRQGREGRQA
jgi:hypothetical protein